ncbi:hypothetical protein EZV62_008396 [Acer yangbiense]|uniref:Uncharacterized protein n=1 Tax=Acer yangbiense TaxID=1000413 RepID=A0A5C7ID90_9ROSI|nr:hypothetical protein EZV62_008396 [Acer yangbiense]
MAKWMAEQIGEVVEIPADSRECWGKFMRVKVRIDISKPLRRWLQLKLGKTEEITTVSLKYERLPEFCYACRRVGHGIMECLDVEARKQVLDGTPTKFGGWLKALIGEKLYSRNNSQGYGSFLDRVKSTEGSREGEGDGSVSLRPASLASMKVSPVNTGAAPVLEKIGTLIAAEEEGLIQSNVMCVDGPASKKVGQSKKSKSPFKSKGPVSNLSLKQKEGSMSQPVFAEQVCKRKMVFDPSDSESRGLPKAMIGLSWNVRGPGNPCAFAALLRLLKCHSPDLVFLSETKLISSKVSRLKLALGYGGWFCVDSVGSSGGLLLFWKDSISVSVLSSSLGHIDARVSMADGFCWRFSGFYGDPNASNRSSSWSLLHRLKEVVEECNLVDLGFLGPRLTWNNKREGKNNIQERLDMFLANESWRDQFWNAQLEGNISPSHTVFMPSAISSLGSLHVSDQYFLASTMDGSVKLYDHRIINRGHVQSYEGHVNSRTRIQLGVDQSERFVMSGGEDNNLRIWSIKSGELLFDDKFSNSIPHNVRWWRPESKENLWERRMEDKAMKIIHNLGRAIVRMHGFKRVKKYSTCTGIDATIIFK